MATTPFLGCKISLISKSEIRYEGILYTIDPKESTIALAKVKSFGTEDRQAERSVPPRDEIFEYIIFRAGDIKDLIVDDPPTGLVGPISDPAIIQAHSTTPSASAATFPSSTFPNSGLNTTAGQRPGVAPFGTTTIEQLMPSNQAKAIGSTESRSRNSTPTNVQPHRQSPPAHDVWPKDRQRPNKENHQRGGGGGGGGERAQAPHVRRGGPMQHNQGQNYGHPGGNRGRGAAPNNFQRQTQPHQPHRQNQFGGQGGYNRPYNQSYQRGGQRPQSRPQNHQRGAQNRISNRPAKEPLKFEEDFDFDKANEDFKEIEEKMSNLKVDQPTEKPAEGDTASDQKSVDGATNGDKEGGDANDHFYDKTKSFFDTISCEALEREKGNVQRIDWKAERKLNSETFGVPLSYRRFGRGYGRGGGYRGYSGFRPRGNFGQRGGGAGDGRRFNGPAHNRN